MKYSITFSILLIIIFSNCNHSQENKSVINESDTSELISKTESPNLQAFQLLAFDKKKLNQNEKDLLTKYAKGNFIDGRKWLDANGENLAFFIEHSFYTPVPEADGESMLTTNLHVYHFVINNNEYKLIREIKDFEKDCFFDNRARFFEQSITVTDLDSDNYAELIFLYRLGCSSELSPDPLKLMLLENGEKYAIRGSTSVEIGPGEPVLGGEKSPDENFTDLAPAIVQKANELWAEFSEANIVSPLRQIHVDAVQKYTTYALGGVEPIWQLEIFPDRLEFTAALGEKLIVFDYSEIFPLENGYHIIGKAKNTKNESYMFVYILKKSCSDGMSDDEYPISVLVDYQQKQYYGCGRLK